jgi:hypothetical protein
MTDNKNQGFISSMIVALTVILVIIASCSGCSTVVPVTSKFPDAPGKTATIACPQLEKLKDEAKLSDVSRTVAVNYETYYECAVKNDVWIEWYQIQKKIYEELK